MARQVLNGLAVSGAASVTGRADAVQLAVKANGTQTVALQEWQSSVGAVLSYIGAGGDFITGVAIIAGPAGYVGGNLSISSQNGGQSPAVVRGATSQNVDLQQWQNVGGTPLAVVDKTGLGDFSVAGLRTKHESGATPTGGSSGEVRAGTDKLWVQDAGTWKSVAVSAAGAPSFASTVKWGTD